MSNECSLAFGYWLLIFVSACVNSFEFLQVGVSHISKTVYAEEEQDLKLLYTLEYYYFNKQSDSSLVSRWWHFLFSANFLTCHAELLLLSRTTGAALGEDFWPVYGIGANPAS